MQIISVRAETEDFPCQKVPRFKKWFFNEIY